MNKRQQLVIGGYELGADPFDAAILDFIETPPFATLSSYASCSYSRAFLRIGLHSRRNLPPPLRTKASIFIGFTPSAARVSATGCSVPAATRWPSGRTSLAVSRSRKARTAGSL